MVYVIECQVAPGFELLVNDFEDEGFLVDLDHLFFMLHFKDILIALGDKAFQLAVCAGPVYS